ncbi:MAG: LysE family translocator [Pseudomonadota bacterium]
MTLDVLLNLTGVAFAASWTPGPNNVMLAASGAAFGWRRTQPHAFGITLGFPVMIFAVALGFGQIFQAIPVLKTAMLWIGCAVMLWFAWRIASAGSGAEPEASGAARPLSLLEGAAFQWINPKSWAMAIGVAGAFISAERPLADALIASGVFAIAALTSTQAWSGFGTGMRQFLGTGERLRAFNLGMGLLLAGCAIWIVLDA